MTEDPTPAPLPDGVFDGALAAHLALQERRLRTMYNWTRAVFAEQVVAALLPGAEVVVDPAAAWDVGWPVGRRTIRIEVKTTGGMLPRMGAEHLSPSRWSFPTPKGGFDATTKTKLPAGRNFDVLVLAQHAGLDIERGWTFWVLSPKRITRDRNVSPAHLKAMGAVECGPADLERTVRAALKG